MNSLQSEIKQAAHECDVSFRQSYSGRGMFGRSCIAVTGSLSDVQTVIAQTILALQEEVIQAVQDAGEDEEKIDAADDMRGILSDYVETILDYKTDNMGGWDIVAYWPKLEWQGEAE